MITNSVLKTFTSAEFDDICMKCAKDYTNLPQIDNSLMISTMIILPFKFFDYVFIKNAQKL